MAPIGCRSDSPDKATDPEPLKRPMGEPCLQMARCRWVDSSIRITRRRRMGGCPCVDDVDPRPMARTEGTTFPRTARWSASASGSSRSPRSRTSSAYGRPGGDSRVRAGGPMAGAPRPRFPEIVNCGVIRALKVQLLYVDSCPHRTVMEERLRHVLDLLGSAATVEHCLVDTQEAADLYGFAGSPSILLDGRDPFRTTTETFGLTCRVYSTPEGPAGAPTVEQLTRAVREAASN